MMSATPFPALRGLDDGITREIAAIRAIDQHAHPVPLGVELPGDPEHPIQPYDLCQPLRMRPENREYSGAWADLWGHDEGDWSLPSLAKVIERKERTIAREGRDYNCWVLDRLGIATMIGMAPGPQPSQPAPRFEWCAFSDWFLWPFPVSDLPLSGMQRSYRSTNDQFVARWCPDRMPSTVESYIDEVVARTLAHYKAQGAVGIKFHGPYNRPLNFEEVALIDARTLFDQGVTQGALPFRQHKALQDFLFERLTTLAGAMGLVVQIHTGYGVIEGFVTAGSNPLLMERLLHAVKGTKFVLLHGGWPFITETVALLGNSNVYADFSCATLYQYPRSLSTQIRAALEWYPEKLLFGTDAYSERSVAILTGTPFLANPLGGWEEKAWLMNRTGRTALALALSGMRDDGEVDATRVEELGRLVMRETAAGLYGLDL